MINQHILNTAPVSVVIPCYKCAATIYRAIESVVNQTKKPAEIILVDDASGDGTLEILLNIEKQHTGWVKVIALDKNQGAANARNVGWEATTQPYIALLDSDDAWHPDKLKHQYSFMKKNTEVVLSGHDMRLLKSQQLGFWPVSDCKVSAISKKRLLLSNPFVTSSVMIKRDIPLRFDNAKRYMEDYLLWLEVAFKGYSIVKLNSPLVAFYKPQYGESGLSANLWAMEKSELDNYWRLFLARYISLFTVSFLTIYSLIKYLRRLVIVKLRYVKFV